MLFFIIMVLSYFEENKAAEIPYSSNYVFKMQNYFDIAFIVLYKSTMTLYLNNVLKILCIDFIYD